MTGEGENTNKLRTKNDCLAGSITIIEIVSSINGFLYFRSTTS